MSKNLFKNWNKSQMNLAAILFDDLEVTLPIVGVEEEKEYKKIMKEFSIEAKKRKLILSKKG